MKTSIVSADPKYFECPVLDTEQHLKASLGEPLQLPDHIDSSNWVSDEEPALLRWFARLTSQQYQHNVRDNTYNSDNDLSSNFVFSIYTPVDCADWCYADDVFVTVETHLGGDVRGNYSSFQVYRLNDIADSGFFNWIVAWHAEPISKDYDSELPELQSLNDRFCTGYSRWPTGEVCDNLVSKEPAWSDKIGAYVARLIDVPFPVILRPSEPYYA